jgi:hypothetical protein
MKLILENWKKFINENEGTSNNGFLVLQGILLLHPNDQIKNQLIQLANEVKEKNADAVPLQPDKMHLTLAHQSVFKDKEVAKKLKELIASNSLTIPEIKLGEVGVKIGEGDQQGRKSWAVKIQNQKDFKDFVDGIKAKVKEELKEENKSITIIDEPQERVFHFSLANLTGNPGDSVR